MSGFSSWDAPQAGDKRISLSEGFINIDLGQDDVASPSDFDSFVNHRGGGVHEAQSHQPQHHSDSQFVSGAGGQPSGAGGSRFQDVDFNAPSFGNPGAGIGMQVSLNERERRWPEK